MAELVVGEKGFEPSTPWSQIMFTLFLQIKKDPRSVEFLGFLICNDL